MITYAIKHATYQSRPQLFKKWIALPTGKMSIQWIVQMASLILIHWIEIYPMDSAIQLSEQPGPALLVLPNP